MQDEFLVNARRSIGHIGVSFEKLESFVTDTALLHIVAMKNNMPVLFYLLKSAHNVTRESVDDDTIARCADTLNFKDGYGNTVMHYMALRNGFLDESDEMRRCMHILRGFGADLKITNNAKESVHDVLRSCAITCTSHDATAECAYFDAMRDAITISKRDAYIEPCIEHRSQRCIIM